MPLAPPSEVSAGGVVVRAAAGRWQVCLVRAGRHWGFPKGHVEPGESPEETALREISEECGFPLRSLTVVATLPPSRYVYRRRGRLVFKLVHQFVVLCTHGGEPVAQAEEIDEAVWCELDAAESTVSFRDGRAALDAARPLLAAVAAGAPAIGREPPRP